MKTGFVCASGYNQVGSATRNGRTLIGVVLGRESQNDRAETLADILTQGFAESSGNPLVAGVPSADGPPNIRSKTCPNGSPPAEDANLSEPNSPYLVRKPSEVVNPLRITIGKPDGPIPAAAAAFFGGKKAKAEAVEKPVPVPTPRPDDTPAKAEIRGTLPTKQP
jgi:D-alanyl-D-alanine carboxypeptidase